MLKKCTPLWREAHFEVKSVKNELTGSEHFWTFRCRFAWQRKGFCTLSKVSKTRGFCSSQRGRSVIFEQDLDKGALRVAGALQETCSSDSSEMLGGQGADFTERGCILEHQIFRFAIRWFLRHRCSTSYDLASLFRGRGTTFTDRWSAKIAKRHCHEAVSSCIQLSIFEGSLAELLRFWRLVNFENWGSLAELLRFWLLSSLKHWGQSTQKQLRFQPCRYTDKWIDGQTTTTTTATTFTLQLQIQMQLYYATVHYTTLHYYSYNYTNYTTTTTTHYSYTILLQLQLQLHYITLH